MTSLTAYRTAVAVAVGAALLLIYGIGALGVIGAEGDRADLMYLGVLGTGLIGALVARFRPHGMAVTLAAAALIQVVVTIIALAAGLGGTNPWIEIIGLNGMFVALFLASAWLFQQAAMRGAHTRHGRAPDADRQGPGTGGSDTAGAGGPRRE